ncbi:inhibitor of apoptosis protein [Helicoverpa zea nudivirus 2]|uniref:Inhibitor of apoptosis protein n=1 Tax=Helicoverpa zea nudivirus 2 TaxID=1128424 RepID=G9I038_HZNV2|nr:orf12 gene product [Helicoverpa zea nudivirus 2]AEW69561.1 inhibitor of apoptosis protein [Helicoverpa zea nudivirus 2]
MNEIERIETFTSSNWKDSMILGMKLAKTGFYFCGANILKCTFCKCILLWNSKEYQEFVNKPQLIHIRLSPTCEYAYANLPMYANPQYRYFKSRLDSFIGNWSVFKRPTPIALAEAGFFYAGMVDCTKCFYCDGGLNDWNPCDDPWEQHAIHFDRCVFLLYKKGPLYVESIKKRILGELCWLLLLLSF